MTTDTISTTIRHVNAISKNMKEGKGMSIIRDLREEADFTAFMLASKSGVSVSSINRMETGKAKVTRRIARRVIKVLNEKLNRSITLEDIEELVK